MKISEYPPPSWASNAQLYVCPRATDKDVQQGCMISLELARHWLKIVIKYSLKRHKNAADA